jgi:DNA-3-methyladenine glycosylase II
MELLKDEEIRYELKKIKGIGDWTVDVYLLFVLQRMDIFPAGDLAMMNTIKHLKQLPKQTTKEEIIAMAESWRPYRSVAAYMLWHYYIQSGGIRV